MDLEHSRNSSSQITNIDDVELQNPARAILYSDLFTKDIQPLPPPAGGLDLTAAPATSARSNANVNASANVNVQVPPQHSAAAAAAAASAGAGTGRSSYEHQVCVSNANIVDDGRSITCYLPCTGSVVYCNFP